MSSVAHPLSRTSRSVLHFVVGVILLIGTWTVLYSAESLFTESHLVGYTCCATEQDLPAPGTVERTLSDFFRTSPGMHLPALLFIAVNAGLFIAAIHRSREAAGWGTVWWLPYLFIAFNILYLVVDFLLMGVSWSISDYVLGPQTSVYKGYIRTWYGMVLHLLLWGGFFIALSKIPMQLQRKFSAISG